VFDVDPYPFASCRLVRNYKFAASSDARSPLLVVGRSVITVGAFDIVTLLHKNKSHDASIESIRDLVAGGSDSYSFFKFSLMDSSAYRSL
jgi:hypothetical protein